jgi:hypothetical protein
MQSAKNIQNIEPLQVKSEVITIEEDEIQTTENDDFRLLDEPNEISNGGASNLIYYFEPQEKSNLIISLDDKSKLQLVN